MYMVIRKYDIFPTTIEEFIRDVQEHLTPIISRMPGFRDYYLLEITDREVVVVTIFDTLADAKRCGQETMAWVAKHSEVFFQGFSKPIAGQVRFRCKPSQAAETDLLQGSF